MSSCGRPLFGDVVQDVALAFGLIAEQLGERPDHGGRNPEQRVAGHVHHGQLVVGAAGVDGGAGEVAQLFDFEVADARESGRPAGGGGAAAVQDRRRA